MPKTGEYHSRCRNLNLRHETGCSILRGKSNGDVQHGFSKSAAMSEVCSKRRRPRARVNIQRVEVGVWEEDQEVLQRLAHALNLNDQAAASLRKMLVAILAEEQGSMSRSLLLAKSPSHRRDH
ncbi:MAG TPA: hypothetical protein VNS22_18690 [Geminicoccus sp.]|uniref:hypothetical protein n=1 Tax=Geminicoccus sp. TaxID=2024832 RepID=UPI002BFFE832|nr:hypothetical protein [Geminicoccus sp.]HWL70390.1 hypothetical protein [Geminicoccus sp.]